MGLSEFRHAQSLEFCQVHRLGEVGTLSLHLPGSRAWRVNPTAETRLGSLHPSLLVRIKVSRAQAPFLGEK